MYDPYFYNDVLKNKTLNTFLWLVNDFWLLTDGLLRESDQE